MEDKLKDHSEDDNFDFA
jgi:hypothetical protein